MCICAVELSDSAAEPTADAPGFARTKLVNRVLNNKALTPEEKIRQSTDLTVKYSLDLSLSNLRQYVAFKYDEFDMFVAVKEAAVDLITLLLQETPLSYKAVDKAEQDAFDSPLGAAPSSPLSDTSQESSAYEDQAGPSIGAVPNSPFHEALALEQVQIAGPSSSISTSHTAPTSLPPGQPPLTPTSTPLPAVAASSDLNASTRVMQAPLDKHAQLGHLGEDAPGLMTPPIWQTPSASAWKQISTLVLRAEEALEWVSQLHTDITEATATAAARFKRKLVKLLLQLLQGHFGDVTLDFDPILREGISPIVLLLKEGGMEGEEEGGPIMTLATLFLKRMKSDVVEGRLQDDADGFYRARQISSILALLGNLIHISRAPPPPPVLPSIPITSNCHSNTYPERVPSCWCKAQD